MMNDGNEVITVGKASLDAVLRERDNAVTRMQQAEDVMRQMKADHWTEQRGMMATIDRLREENAVLKRDNEALARMVAQWSDVDNPSVKYTLVLNEDLDRLHRIAQQARKMADIVMNNDEDEDDDIT